MDTKLVIKGIVGGLTGIGASRILETAVNTYVPMKPGIANTILFKLGCYGLSLAASGAASKAVEGVVDDAANFVEKVKEGVNNEQNV